MRKLLSIILLLLIITLSACSSQNKELESLKAENERLKSQLKSTESVASTPESTSTITNISTTNMPVQNLNDVTIMDYGFMNKGTETAYYVAFSDSFNIIMNIPKGKLENSPLYEYVSIKIGTAEKGQDININTPSIVGFSESLDENYYPLDFSIYSKGLPNDTISDLKKYDFYENFKSYKPDDDVFGMIVYDSFIKLDGISYNDGVHKCKLYLEDKNR